MNWGLIEVEIPQNLLEQVLNIDETCFALDGGSGQRGECPAIVYNGKYLHEVGKAFSKLSLPMIMIMGSTSAREGIPPHFQFSTMAQSENMMHCAQR